MYFFVYSLTKLTTCYSAFQRLNGIAVYVRNKCTDSPAYVDVFTL